MNPGDGARVPPLRYVALGDSYTIGTATRSPGERWPNQLVARIGGPGRSVMLDLVANLGVNGATSADVRTRQLPLVGELDPGFVSLLVGVNDVVQAVGSDAYRANVAAILDALLQRVPATRVVTVSTPDYTVTPQGAAYGDLVVQAAGIRRNNAILEGEATARGIRFVDIHDLSLIAAKEPALVADDGLHPSGEQYRRWVDRIAPVVVELLGQ